MLYQHIWRHEFPIHPWIFVAFQTRLHWSSEEVFETTLHQNWGGTWNEEDRRGSINWRRKEDLVRERETEEWAQKNEVEEWRYRLCTWGGENQSTARSKEESTGNRKLADADRKIVRAVRYIVEAAWFTAELSPSDGVGELAEEIDTDGSLLRCWPCERPNDLGTNLRKFNRTHKQEFDILHNSKQRESWRKRIKSARGP